MKRWIEVRGRIRRHKIIRKRLAGSKERPRVSVYRSLKGMYAQIVDDSANKTLVSVSTVSPALKGKIGKDGGNVKGALLLGGALAEACKAKGITKVVFDRSGYLYHGRIKAFADAARKGGLEF